MTNCSRFRRIFDGLYPITQNLKSELFKSVSYMIVADPSEAVRSSEIVPLLEDYFSILEIKGYGGAILHELLYDIAGNFCEENTGSLDRLRKLFEIEDQLTASQTVNDDFAVIIATGRKIA